MKEKTVAEVLTEAFPANPIDSEKDEWKIAMDFPTNLVHKFYLREDVLIEVALPPDLNHREAQRVADWILTLPF